ncbi:hypothetical protein GP486_006562 [Trichoglossum hirsutum]|uniref:Uncharacterized protein n=1 Tax=Trichoglossum hirsutum TaxID=265104 RepID=A0A9P8IK18_9PEZI|nr:hypothetical protein GP486_006562 [Trichoglossum hirsutum]
MLKRKDKLKDHFLKRQIAASTDVRLPPSPLAHITEYLFPDQPQSSEQSSDTNDESGSLKANQPRGDQGATLRELGRNLASEYKLSGDLDDDQTARLFETLFRHIKFWCHENAQLNHELISDKNFEYLRQLKSEDVRVEDLLDQPRGSQYVARAFISQWLQEAIFDMGSVKSRVTDALRVIEEEMSERGTSEKDINLWRSTTMRILDSKNHNETEIEALEIKEIREHILRWMEANFGLVGGGDGPAQTGNDLQTQVIDRASKLFLEMRKKSSSLEVRLHFEPRGRFLSEYMEDVMARDHSETPSGIKLVVTPALLRLTGPNGDRLERPKVLRKAKVFLCC